MRARPIDTSDRCRALVRLRAWCGFRKIGAIRRGVRAIRGIGAVCMWQQTQHGHPFRHCTIFFYTIRGAELFAPRFVVPWPEESPDVCVDVICDWARSPDGLCPGLPWPYACRYTCRCACLCTDRYADCDSREPAMATVAP